MKKAAVRLFLIVLSFGLFAVPRSKAQTLPLLATSTLDQSDHSKPETFTDLSGLTYALENGVPANSLGGFGSAITYASGNTFLALPDRGPNAVTFDLLVDNTDSYINRFHTITMELKPNKPDAALPFTLTPTLTETTLLWSRTPLFYGSGYFQGTFLGVGDGAPELNGKHRYFFTGRSDNFDPDTDSGDSRDARFDPEGMRLSNDGRHIFISDEYGPHVYEFDRFTGKRTRSFELPSSLLVTNQSPVGADEVSGNTVVTTPQIPGIPINTKGRVDNKGMEGLAITPDGRTLAGIVQNALIQDANSGVKNAKNFLRIVTIDIKSGLYTHQYGYLLTDGSGVSEIVAVNDHQFLVDERDGNGRESGGDETTPSTPALVKKLFKIDLQGATDISGLDNGTMTPAAAIAAAIPKTLFLDIVQSLVMNGIDAGNIPAKIEGVSFGPDIKEEDCAPKVWNLLRKNHGKDGQGDSQGDENVIHTLWIANDNDFLQQVPDTNTTSVHLIPNPNQFFVFSFTDDDLPDFVPQTFDNKEKDKQSRR
jgi:hypothetical protein